MKIATRVTLGALLFTGCVGTVGDIGDFGPGSGSGGSPGTGPIGSAGGSTGTPTGSGGSTGTPGGTGGKAVTGSGGTTGGLPSTGLPCDIQALVQTRCIGCHAATPMNGAPMPLVNFANLIAASFNNPSLTFAQRALVRIQATAGQMPPSPAARATAAEITALGNWIAANYPAGNCGGTGTGGSVGGTGGRAGTGGSAGGTGGRAGTGGMTGTLPCNVQTVYQSHCTSCHAASPVNNAPMPLVTYANLTAPSFTDAAQSFAQRTVVRMQSTTSPMPPSPGTRATAAEVQTVNSWIAAGYPTGTACATGAGGAGGTADPLGAAARCTSGTTWTGGNNGSSLMNPGRACIACHVNQEDAPRWTIAGTVYPTGHEPNLCNGVNGGATGARVVIVDANNQTLTLTPNAAGNFMTTTPIRTPYTAKVTYQGRERIMPVSQTSGDCNNCHTQTGANGAPGRITLP